MNSRNSRNTAMPAAVAACPVSAPMATMSPRNSTNESCGSENLITAPSMPPAAKPPVRKADRWRGTGGTGRFPQLQRPTLLDHDLDLSEHALDLVVQRP